MVAKSFRLTVNIWHNGEFRANLGLATGSWGDPGGGDADYASDSKAGLGDAS